MILVNRNIDSLRSLSEIFTTSNFNKVVRQNDYKLTGKKHCSKVTANATFKKFWEVFIWNFRMNIEVNTFIKITY